MTWCLTVSVIYEFVDTCLLNHVMMVVDAETAVQKMLLDSIISDCMSSTSQVKPACLWPHVLPARQGESDVY